MLQSIKPWEHPNYRRPAEVDVLIGNTSKADKILGWKPQVKFGDLVKILIGANLRAANLEVPGEGDRIIAKKFPKK